MVPAISGLSAVNAVATTVDDDGVLGSGAIFWMAIALGAGAAALLFRSTLKRDARREDPNV
jgi:phosphate/sulfate permease